MSQVKTTNQGLQQQLDRWVQLIEHCFSCTANDRPLAIREFCATFVPVDVTEDDIVHFSGVLSSDEEYFSSLRREITQCSTGNYVESIKGNQRKNATFTLLPPPGTVHDGCQLDIVREVVFISNDGVNWTAEG